MLRGEPVRFGSPADAKARGIGMIYQELSTIGALSVAENVFLGDQLLNRVGLVDWTRMRAEAAAKLRELGIDIDVTERLGLLPLGAQQLVEIARVVFSGAEVVILDEPTSALSEPEAARLFEFMLELKGAGQEPDIHLPLSRGCPGRCRPGDDPEERAPARHPPERRTHQAPADQSHDRRRCEGPGGGLRGGRDAADADRHCARLGDRGLSAAKDFNDVSLTVRSGEIVGMFGFLGSGMTEVARTLFGQIRPECRRHPAQWPTNPAAVEPGSEAARHRVSDGESPSDAFPAARNLQEHYAGPPRTPRAPHIPAEIGVGGRGALCHQDWCPAT